MKPDIIASAANPSIKRISALRQKKYRDESGLFIAEGLRLVEESIRSGWHIEYLVYTELQFQNPDFFVLQHELAKQQTLQPAKFLQVTDAVYHKLSETETPQGILAVVKKRSVSLTEMLTSVENPLLVILDGIQDPGNGGTIIRTADAAGCTGVIALKGCVDLYSGKTLRSTMGSVFHLPAVEGEAAPTVNAGLKSAGIALFAATLDAETLYYDADFSRPAAIVFGNEGNGLSPEMRKELSSPRRRIRIPIYGQAESLNVAMASAIILYEAARQRR